MRLRFLPFCTLSMAVLLATGSPCQSQMRALWSIGTADRDDREFALAPDGYAKYRDDPLFVVGRSDPRADWPYVQPGASDGWAGGRPHTFTVVFALARQPGAGGFRLVGDLVDSQSRQEGKLQIEVNGRRFDQAVPHGASDDSVFGQPEKGKPFHFEIPFGADLLRAGANEIRVTTAEGGWILWDALALQAPATAQIVPATGVTVEGIEAPPMLVGPESALKQALTMTLRNLGPAGEVTVRVNGNAVGHPALRTGMNRVEAGILPVDGEQAATVTVELEGREVGRREVTIRPVRKWIIYLLPHSHHDIGYTDRQADVLRKQMANLDLALDGIHKTAGYPPGARFKWNSEVLWAVDHYLREAPPEKQRALADAVKAGDVELDALYGNELTGLCRPEELVRLLSYKPLLESRCGATIDTAFISDVPGYTWGLTSAFADAGVRYFSMGINYGGSPFHTAWEDKPFYWQSPDGIHKVLCWVPYQGYAMSLVANMKDERVMLDRLAQMDANRYPYDIVQWRWSREDNGAPDLSICDWVREWNEKHAYPRLVIATGHEAFTAFEERYSKQIPTYSGDLTPYWEDGAASTARETAINRSAAERLSQAEALYVMVGPASYPAEAFRKAWSNVVLYDEHTWGAANSVSEPNNPSVRDQWAVKQAFALDADAQSRRLLERVTRVGGSGPLAAIDVYNTTGWPRTDLVTIPAGVSTAGDRVVDAEMNPVSSQRLRSGELVFVARDVPAFGGRRYIVRPGVAQSRGKASASGAGLRSGTLSVTINPATGAIASIRADERELVDQSAPHGFNDYLYVAGTDSAHAQRNGPVKISVQDSGPLVATLYITSTAPGCRSLTRTLRVVDGVERVEIADTLDKEPVLTKEGIHIPFPFNVPGGVMRVDTPWAVVRTETDQLPGSCKNWSTVQRFVDVSNDTFGVAWLPLDAPLIEVGAIRAGQPTPEHLPPAQMLYSYVMNNYWDTNYKASQEGPATFRYAVAPHGPYRGEEAARLGMEFSRPLLVASALGGAPPAPLLSVEPAGVVVETLKSSDDGKAWIIRLFGASGRPERATIHWRAGLAPQLTRSDVSERAGAPITGHIDVPPNGLVTLRAERPAR